MATAVVLLALVFWAAVFVVFFTTQGITASEFFFGRYEPLPGDLGVWKEIAEPTPGDVLREERLLMPDGRSNAGYLIKQVRHRNRATGDIIEVEPEQRIRRRRVSARS